jgi:hypothetical protein
MSTFRNTSVCRGLAWVSLSVVIFPDSVTKLLWLLYAVESYRQTLTRIEFSAITEGC